MTLFRGISFPFRKDDTGFPASATDDELIEESLVQIALTGKNERVMRPEVGTNAYSYVFENNDLILQEKMRADLMASIARYEPRVIIRNIETEREDNQVLATIFYVVKTSGELRQVQVSFPT